jgi:signal peptidase II
MVEPSESSSRQIAGRSRSAIGFFIAVALIVLAADLALKWWAFEHVAGRPIGLTRINATQSGLIPPHAGIQIVPKLLKLKLTLNRGAVFGLGAGGRWVFIAVTFIAIAMITTMFWRSSRTRRWLHTALALILAGALGNLYDRIIYGVDRDMLDLVPELKLPFGWSWPNGSNEIYPWIFNIADAALVCGVCMILLTLFRNPK